MRFPSIAAIRAELVRINRSVDDECDVRLQVYDNGDWATRWGLSDYDQDHRGFWGASTIPGGRRRFNARAVAVDLIEQAREQYALNQTDVEP